MIAIERFGEKDVTLEDIVAGQTKDDLRQMVNRMIDAQLEMIADCEDADVTFVPVDEKAHDPVAATEAETDLAWTLGHVIVHCCASSEEAAFLAAELARGVPNHGRSRYETHWSTMHTVQQCRDALEESRRMRLATLDVWPSQPDLENAYEVWPGGPVANAMMLYASGHRHEYSHFNQIRDIVQQTRSARM